MSDILECLDHRIIQLKQVIQDTKRELSNAPDGTLNICNAGNRVQYYRKEKAHQKRKDSKNDSKVIRRYLKKSDEQLVKALCQKDYNQKVLLSAQKELNQLEKIKSNYPDEVYEKIYEKLTIHRKKFIRPIVLPDEEFIRNWEHVEYEKKGFYKDAAEYYTDKGERVRSKTEILIANALNRHNIPYRYEYPLYLNGYGTIHPDFMALNVRTRKEFYWEHMGMMDNPEYMKDAFRRITMYENNDIFPGENLILTHETSTNPINSRYIEKMIKRYLV